MPLEQRPLGQGLAVSEQGLGGMGMSEFYGDRGRASGHRHGRAVARARRNAARHGRHVRAVDQREAGRACEDDVRRRVSPRLGEANVDRNLELVRHVEELARERGVKPGQIALAWVLAQGQDVVPIPGTKRRKYLQENVGALDVVLTSEDLARIDEITPAGAAAGSRYQESMMQMVGR